MTDGRDKPISMQHCKKYVLLSGYLKCRCLSMHMKFINALNMPIGKGFTPLMIAIKNGYLNSTVSLAAPGADPNICHHETGNTALHLAAEAGNETLVKLLLIFGADLKSKNKAGKTL